MLPSHFPYVPTLPITSRNTTKKKKNFSHSQHDSTAKRSFPHGYSCSLSPIFRVLTIENTQAFSFFPLLSFLFLSLLFSFAVLATTPLAINYSPLICSLLQGRGPKHHLKRLNAPRHWQLGKMGGNWAPRPTPGPHKLRECLPLVILLRNRLKYAFTRREVTAIVMQRLVLVDNKVRTDINYPLGFMDVIQIPKTGEYFRLLYDVKGKFTIHRITKEEAAYKLCRVQKIETGAKGIPFVVTHDGRTIRFPHPDIKVSDSVRISLDGKVLDFIKFEVGNLVMVTGGRNLGRVGVVEKKDRHIGGFDIVHVKDSAGRHFATRLTNCFVIGKGSESYVSLPARKGVQLTRLEQKEYHDAKLKEAKKAAAKK